MKRTRAALMLAALLFLVGAIPAKASLRPCTVHVDLKVVKLPDGPVVDMTKSLDPIAGAIVEVAELGRKGRSDKGTFVVSTGGSPYKSVVRRIFHTPSGGLLLFHRPDQDLYIDESFKRPPKAPVTVVVLDAVIRPPMSTAKPTS